MNNLRNKVQLIGRLGMDPEVKTFGQNSKLARMSVATDESYKNAKGERVTDTTWHTVTAWNSLADLAEKYLQKGKEIAIEGKLINRSYEDKDGVKRYVTEIKATDFVMLGKKEKTVAK